MENKSAPVHGEAKLWQALVTVIVLIITMIYAVVLKGATPHIPLVVGCIAAAVVTASLGYKWEDILGFMKDGISQSLEAILILLCIGALAGTWIASGTVPTMIYYGLSVLNAKYFLAASALICGIVSLAIGAWGTLGTVGIALMGIGTALGIPPAPVVGSVVSGAYLGDALSPLSDATNLSAAVVGRDVFSVVKGLLLPVTAAFAGALLLFFVTGLRYASAEGDRVTAAVAPLLANLRQLYVISPLCLIPLAVIVGCILAKLPAIPSMLCGVLSGAVVAVAGQHVSLSDLITVCTDGNVCETGNELLDNLLTAGGMLSMLSTISIILFAMSFGGLMQHSGQMRALAAPLLSRLHRFGAVNMLTVLSCVLMNVLLPDQYLSISMPGQMYVEAYDRRGYSRTELSTGLVGGAVSSPLIPWNTCGLYSLTLFGVSSLEYLRYSYFNLLAIALVIIFGFVKAAGHRPEA